MIPIEPDQRIRRKLTSHRSAATRVVLFTSGSGFGQRIFGLCPSFPHGLSLHFDLVGVVNETVENGVGQRAVANHLMPVLDRKLAGDFIHRPFQAMSGKDRMALGIVCVRELGYIRGGFLGPSSIQILRRASLLHFRRLVRYGIPSKEKTDTR